MTAVANAGRTKSWGPLTALTIPDLRNKILFTLAMVVVYRLGVHIPVPGVDFAAVQLLRESAKSGGGVLGFLNLFSGGAITNFAIFALGVFPYITASIIMQLLQVVIPRLEEWRKEGATGQKKITQWTRYLAIILAMIQSTGLAVTFARGGGGGLLGSGLELPVPLIPDFTLFTASMVVLTMTAGTVMVMWMGELITQRGIGQGMSMLIFANVVSGMLTQGAAIRAQSGNIAFAIILAMATGILVAIVIVESGQRRISVQFAKRVVGNRQYGGQATHSAEGQPVGRGASYLRQLGFVLPSAHRDRDFERGFANLGVRQLGGAHCAASHLAVRRSHCGVRLLLHSDRVRPSPAGRRAQASGWLHSGHSSGSPNRGVFAAHSEPHCFAGFVVCGSGGVGAHYRPRYRRCPQHVLRWNHVANCGRRSPRDHEADRQSTDHA